MSERRGDWIATYTGKQFWPLDPRPEEVCIEDIAHALSNICRFTGHCRHFYSVAQHSLFVSRHLPDELKLAGLLHDAAEAYLADIARPVKPFIEARIEDKSTWIRHIEYQILDCIHVCFGVKFDQDVLDAIEDVDLRALATERRDLMPMLPAWDIDGKVKPFDRAVIPMNPLTAEEFFLLRFKELSGC